MFYQHRTPNSTGRRARPDGSAVTLAHVTDPATAPVLGEIVERLRAVIDPELGDNIVDLGMVGEVRLEGRKVVVPVKLTIRGCPLRAQIQRDINASVTGHPDVDSVRIEWGEMTPEERSAVMTRARWKAAENAADTAVPLRTRVIAVASGKGGVGKSSVTVNLATALARMGRTVGVLDADIWGFSVPRMLGMPDRLQAEKVEGREKPMIVPNVRRVGDGILEVVSTGMLVEDEGTALMWRGLMLTKAVEQFLHDVRWGDLDYLIIDMPPGTGDVQMGLARMLPRTDLVIVTTPAVSAQKVAIRAADMARRSFLRVAGVIENMSEFTCEHGTSHALFGSGGGAALASEIGAPLLGAIPIEPAVAAGCDAGEPVVLDPSTRSSVVFTAIAERIDEETRARTDMTGCSARDPDVVQISVRAGSPR